MGITAVKNGVFAVIATIGSAIANTLGGWDAALQVLLLMIAVDFITGLIVGGVFKKSPKTETGKLSSSECFKGLICKFMILVYILVAVAIDRLIGAPYIRTAVILFFVANEGLSIIENTALMGVPYPSFIKKLLEVMKDRNDNGGDQK